MPRDGNDVRFRKDVLAVLQQRELRQVGSEISAQIWKNFVELERHIGRAVSGIPHGDDFDWTIGRGRGGPSL